jgi:hypothetical protein
MRGRCNLCRFFASFLWHENTLKTGGHGLVKLAFHWRILRGGGGGVGGGGHRPTLPRLSSRCIPLSSQPLAAQRYAQCLAIGMRFLIVIHSPANRVSRSRSRAAIPQERPTSASLRRPRENRTTRATARCLRPRRPRPQQAYSA